MSRKINELLNELSNKLHKKTISESIKIRKSTPTPNAGYYIFITSDSSDATKATAETSKMARILKLTNDQIKKSEFKKSFNPPQRFADKATGQFGWGYLIHPALSDEQVNILLGNLKELVRDYNVSERLDDDVATGNLTLQQVEFLQKLVGGLEAASDKQMNPETKASIERHLDALEKAIEEDSVYEFLIESYEKAKRFSQNNLNITSHKYSILNSLIIIYSDPEAVLVGSKQYWNGRNYRIKEGASGISISTPDTTGTATTARMVKTTPGLWDKYKKERGIPAGETFENYIRKKNLRYDPVNALAIYAIQNGVARSIKGFKYALVYTDTMVEPIPGKEVDPILGNEEEDAFHIKQRDLESDAERESFTKLAGAVEKYAKIKRIPTLGLNTESGNINELNKVLNLISLEALRDKLKHKEKEPDGPEILKGFSEVVSSIIKNHYGLPSDESKYNIARRGVDRDQLKKDSDAILSTSDYIIKLLDNNMKQLPLRAANSLNEVRQIVRNVIRKLI